MSTGRLAPEPPEEPSKPRQITEAVAQGGAGMVPVVGTFFAAALAYAFNAMHQKRAHEWMEEVAEVVQELLDRVDDLEEQDLTEDPDFYDAVVAATRVALATSSTEKHRTLQNSLYNTGAGAAPDADKRAIYLRYIDELTPSHMRLLQFMDNPQHWYASHGLAWPNLYAGGLISIIEPAFPELAGDRPFLDTLVKDLGDTGMIASPGLSGTMTSQGLAASRSTEKGREFMRFVSGPFAGE